MLTQTTCWRWCERLINHSVERFVAECKLVVSIALFDFPLAVLSAALYFGSWFFCKSNDPIPDVANPALSQNHLSPPQTPVPGLEIRQQRQAAGQQTTSEEEALAQAGPANESLSPVPGFARFATDDESVYLSFKNAGDESQPVTQFESSI